MLLKQYLIIYFSMVIFLFPSTAHALELKVSEETSGTDCSQCDDMCREPVEGESIKSLNNWICQQCLSLCLQKSAPPEDPEEFIPSPCPAKPIVRLHETLQHKKHV